MIEIKRDANSITVKGSIIKIEDFHRVRSILDELADNNPSGFVFKLIDADMITSSLLGHMLKIRKKDNIQLNIVTNSQKLLHLLTRLKLANIFNAKLI